MEVKELRIGNYYDHNGEFKKVTPNTILEVWEAKRIWCKPIPLTEQWLLDLGFGVSSNIYFKEFKNGNYIGINLSKKEIDLGGDDSCTSGMMYNVRNILYIHQLQNIYFTLTNEELTLKSQ